MEGKVGYEKPRRVFTQGSNWQPRQVHSLALEEFRDPTGAAPNYATALSQSVWLCGVIGGW
jgi:hypothetical protein